MRVDQNTRYRQHQRNPAHGPHNPLRATCFSKARRRRGRELGTDVLWPHFEGRSYSTDTTAA
jgi:hypothetical protein